VKTLYPKFIPYMNSNCMPSPTMFPKMNLQLARVYIPLQPFIGLLPLNEALKQGTIFPNLVMPYKKAEKR
jgi:hypothetical protein